MAPFAVLFKAGTEQLGSDAKFGGCLERADLASDPNCSKRQKLRTPTTTRVADFAIAGVPTSEIPPKLKRPLLARPLHNDAMEDRVARLPRYFAEHLTQHVIQRGNDRTATFRVPEDYLVFLTFLRRASDTSGVRVHAFALMTNHVHLLVTPETAKSLPRMMQAVGSSYVPYFNKRHQRSGTLWEGRYRAFAIETEQYLLTCLRYVECNPVRAGMVDRPEQYPWSSYRANAFGIEDPLVTTHPYFTALWGGGEERRENYRRLCGMELAQEELAAIRDASQNGWALGAQDFVEAVQARCGRPATRRSRGRKRISV